VVSIMYPGVLGVNLGISLLKTNQGKLRKKRKKKTEKGSKKIRHKGKINKT
jgi:hypothetical protein